VDWLPLEAADAGGTRREYSCEATDRANDGPGNRARLAACRRCESSDDCSLARQESRADSGHET